jgi:hypothetical protein
VVTLDERLECAPVPGGYRGGEAASAVERIDAHQVDAEVAQPL